jgi:hypothetical protein
MVPWPTAYVEAPFVQQPMMSPTQQSPENQDRFAAYNAGQCMPPSNYQTSNQQPMQSQQHQPQQPMQQTGYVDPWTAMNAQPAPVPMAPPPKQSSPPPSMVVYDYSNQAPTSPIGDVSVMVAPANNSNVAPPTAAPANPFDFCYVASSIPSVAPTQLNMPPSTNMQPSMNMPPPPNMPPPTAPPSPPRAESFPVVTNPQQYAPQLQVQPTSPFGYAASSTPEQQSANPLFTSSPLQQTTIPPSSPAAAFSPTPHPGIADPFGYASSPTPQQTVAPLPASFPQYSFAPQQAYEDPFGYAFSPMTSPVTSPNGSPGAGAGAIVPCTASNTDPFGVATASTVGLPPFLPSTQDPATSHAMVPSVGVGDADPFGVFGSQPNPANVNSSGSSALITSGVVDSDPFGLFGAPTPAANVPPQLQLSAPITPVEGDLLGGVGYEHASFQPHATSFNTSNSSMPEEQPITLDSNNLPSEGEYYEARIAARTLGAMFYSARNLENTLLYKMPNNVMEALGSRPVVVGF